MASLSIGELLAECRRTRDEAEMQRSRFREDIDALRRQSEQTAADRRALDQRRLPRWQRRLTTE
jgi:hypothetical protein